MSKRCITTLPLPALRERQGRGGDVVNSLRRFVCLCWLLFVCGQAAAIELAEEQLPPLPDPIGVAGPFVGVDGGAVIVAGGANFAPPVWEAGKAWQDAIWVLLTGSGERPPRWAEGGRLLRPLAYGVSVSTSAGVVCVGGNDSTATFADAFLLRWDGEQQRVEQLPLPPLPQASAYGCAAAIGDTVYVAAGTPTASLADAEARFWSLDVSGADGGGRAWQELPGWPGPPRGFGVLVAQHNGESDCLYLISGRWERESGEVQLLRDVYEFSPARHTEGREPAWQQRADVPRCVMAGAGVSLGQSHLLILGGDDGRLFGQADILRDDHPGFPAEALAYHTITNTWTPVAGMPAPAPVTTTAVRLGPDPLLDPIILPTGEVRPRVRTSAVWSLRLKPEESRFGAVDASVLGLYLLAMIAVGGFFSLRNKDTDDFFRGGQRVPWIVAGLSIFATMLSSITFMAIPSKAYATDWVYFPVNMMVVVITPLVVSLFLPFFRKIDATSAYEYLEKRFNRFVRLFASGSFVLFQVGRMAVVLYLSALALAVITPLTEEQSILLMGLLSIIYCALGGLEAVVWTDTVQSVVLLGGAVASLALILMQVDGGVGGFLDAASAQQKLHLVNLDFSATSFTTTAIWVVVLGGLAQALVPYSSDMAVVQRYMAVSDIGRARRAIWTNAIAVVPASLLFFGVGTALFVFYSQYPERLDPAFKTDAIFPLFISRELPAGLSGLVVAGIFAAAQSTISTSMNSMSTAVVTDFVRPYVRGLAERGSLWLGRSLTVVFGGLGVWLAMLFASADIKSLWDQFMTILGLLGGSMCGLFCLGIFTTRAHATGAMVGAILGAVILYAVQHLTSTHLLLYAAVGVSASFVTGYVASLLLPAGPRSIAGLTVYTIGEAVADQEGSGGRQRSRA
jgi:SSS family solute:Na+ symporter